MSAIVLIVCFFPTCFNVTSLKFTYILKSPGFSKPKYNDIGHCYVVKLALILSFGPSISHSAPPQNYNNHVLLHHTHRSYGGAAPRGFMEGTG